MQSTKISPYLFIAILTILSLLYGYTQEIQKRPHGYHGWRQCDGASTALNYYQVNMNFFEPRLSICSGKDGKMVSEFPIVYFTAACLYKIFGVHESFIRLLSIAIFFVGLFYLFKAISLLLNNEFYGLLLSLMPFTSAVIIDYAFGFLPDVPALSCTFIGYCFFIKFCKQNQSKNLWWAAAFFTMAGLLKITSLIGYGAINATIVLVLLFKNKSATTSGWLKHKISLAAFVFVPLLICGCWIAFVKHYNAANQNGYFTTDIRPIWEGDWGFIKYIAGRFTDEWLRAAIYRDFLNAMPFVFVMCYLFPNRKNWALLIWLFFALLFTATYLILFYLQFTVHDYYLICMLFLPVAICVVFLYQLKEWKENIFNSLWLKTAVTILLVVMIYHGRRISLERDQNPRSDEFTEYFSIEKDLNNLGITKDKRVISVGDYSSGMTLYYMNRRGWSELGIFTPFHVNDIKNCIDHGAQYLLIRKDCDNRIDAEATALYAKNLIATVNGIKIYKL